jgi:adenine-specific DNA-methyltransferase
MANVKGGRYVKSLYYPIINPLTGEKHYPSSNGNWRFNKEKIEELIKNNEIYFGEDGKGRPKLKRFLRDVKEGITYGTIWDFVPLNQAGSREMAELLGNMNIFDNPKPSGLISELLKLGASKDINHIILDFFGGSCTTGHAVLDLNKQDGGNRKFIMVQLPEPCAPDSEAFKAGYKTIADIGKERIRRVIKKIQEEQAQKKDLFSGDKPELDLGFKVFKLEPSNFKLWNDQIAKDKDAIKNQLEMFVEHINPKSSQEDILYELLLKSGFPLTTKIEQLPMTDKAVFSIDEGAMLICLEKDLTPEVIKAMAEKKPVRVICLDEGFHGNDQLKTNAVQIMKSRDIKFRTV